MMSFQLNVNPEGIGELKFNLANEKVNKFSLQVLAELEIALDEVKKNSLIKLLKFTSGKANSYIVGADLHALEAVFNEPEKAKEMILTGHRVFNKLAALPFPTLAIINGACLGGGCEFALRCTYRAAIDHAKTQIALPEVNLGIYPGWGGTQTLPRLIGLTEGLNFILTGKPLSAYQAWRLHLVDALIPEAFQEAKEKEFIAEILTKKGHKKVLQRRSHKPLLQKMLDNNSIGRAILYAQAEKKILEKTKGHYPAPLIALKLIKETYHLPLQAGLEKEAETFLANVPQGFTQAKVLISLFFTQEALKKETGAPPETAILPIRYAAVIGAGTMGSAVAWLLSMHGIITRLKDVSWEILGKGMGTIRALYNKNIKANKITSNQAELGFQLVSGTVDHSGISHANLAIEAATENLELKKRIFQDLESVVSETAIIATNTSSLSINVMAEALKHRERFIGMHFFNPVSKMPLVEIVPGAYTSPEVIATAMNFCRKLGKTPILIKDCPGFLVNRIFLAGANEIMRMLEEGYAIEELNKVSLDFGMPMGALELADEVGLDVLYKVSDVLEKGYGERMHPSKLVELMVNEGFIGKKSGKGFYIYKGSSKTRNAAVTHLLQLVGRQTLHLPQEDILPRFLYLMINEAARCLEEGIISCPEFLDMALIMGIGFPPYHGGLLRYADRVGTAHVLTTLELLQTKHGMRFMPCKLLQKMGKDNKGFYYTQTT